MLSIDNPNYHALVDKYPHLKSVNIIYDDTKDFLSFHVVLGSGEYARIKTQTKPRARPDNSPVAELTCLFISPGKEFDKNIMPLAQTSQSDYEDLCRLDVLELRDTVEL